MLKSVKSGHGTFQEVYASWKCFYAGLSTSTTMLRASTQYDSPGYANSITGSAMSHALDIDVSITSAQRRSAICEIVILHALLKEDEGEWFRVRYRSYSV